MKKILTAFAVVALFCVFAVVAARAGKQNKQELPPEPLPPIMVTPGGSCAAQGMAAAADAVWLAGECEKRETARYFLAMGQYKAALAIMCTSRAAKESKACAEP